MYRRCQCCGAKFSLSEFVTLPEVCNSCQIAGRKVSDHTKAVINARGERTVGRLMVATGFALCGIAIVVESRAGNTPVPEWKLVAAGLGILAAGFARVRITNRRLKKLERETR